MTDQADTETAAVPPQGIAVDGRFWTTDDLTHAQYLEARALVRASTGDRTITYLDDPGVSEADLMPAIVYVVRRYHVDGGNEKYTYDDALKLTPRDIERMREEALAALPPDKGPQGPEITPSEPSAPSTE